MTITKDLRKQWKRHMRHCDDVELAADSLTGPIYQHRDGMVERVGLQSAIGKAWDPSLHPRGQPENPGQFVEAGASTRIAPLTGEGAKTRFASDLTMANIPEHLQTEMKARLQHFAGITPEEGTQNLVDMFESVPAEMQQTAAKWYPEAHDFCVKIAKEHHIDPHVSAAVVAALSPGQEWTSNKAGAEMVLNAFDSGRTVTPEEAEKVAKVFGKRKATGKPSRKGDDKRGVTPGEPWSDVFKRDPRTGAVLIGRANGLQLRTYDNLEKAVRLRAQNDPHAISGVLNGPKVRSFFNNLDAPLENKDDVCIDKHMMRAMVNGTTSPGGHRRIAMVEDNESVITGTPKYRSASLGLYPLMADMVREATRRINEQHHTAYLPSEVQAIVWTRQIDNWPIGRIRALLNPTGTKPTGPRVPLPPFRKPGGKS